MGRLLVRGWVLAAIAGVTVMVVAELGEVRGELAFARFRCMRRLAEKSSHATDVTKAVELASMEAELVMRFSERNPDALWEVIVQCLGWSEREDLEPLLRLRLGEKATRAAVLAVRAAPSDYESWLWFARSQASLGLWEKAEKSLKRARELGPPGMALGIFTGMDDAWRGSEPGRVARRAVEGGQGG